MNSATKLVKSRVGLLNLAEQLNNVTRACKLMGIIAKQKYAILKVMGSVTPAPDNAG